MSRLKGNELLHRAYAFRDGREAGKSMKVIAKELGGTPQGLVESLQRKGWRSGIYGSFLEVLPKIIELLETEAHHTN